MPYKDIGSASINITKLCKYCSSAVSILQICKNSTFAKKIIGKRSFLTNPGHFDQRNVIWILIQIQVIWISKRVAGFFAHSDFNLHRRQMSNY